MLLKLQLMPLIYLLYLFYCLTRMVILLNLTVHVDKCRPHQCNIYIYIYMAFSFSVKIFKDIVGWGEWDTFLFHFLV
uniref:Uncharacterized protein n=1 Tax=Ciona intestinalis TaxID=7719 RepID=H2XNS9_CIOIN